MLVTQKAITHLPILVLNGKLFCMLAMLVLLPSLICTFQCASGLLLLPDRDPSS